MIAKEQLEQLYIKQKLSMFEISRTLNCSANQVVYWMNRYNIKRRSISEAVYLRSNPKGDPFYFHRPNTNQEYLLMGLGLGLYWGEGTKSNKHAVRIGNTDPELIKMFMAFLINLFHVDKDNMRFGLQIFTDIDTEEALSYWTHELNINREQFYKPIVTLSESLGTYRRKCQYGVLTLHFNNKKLRDIIVGLLPR